MAGTPCPYTGCPWVIPACTDELSVVLLQGHLMNHRPTPGPTPTKMESVKRPTISLEGTAEEWGYFCLLARHYPGHRHHKSEVQALQRHGPIPG